MNHKPVSHKKVKPKLCRIVARLLEDEARLRAAALLCRRYPLYAEGLCQAVSADLKDTWREFDAIRQLINRKENF